MQRTSAALTLSALSLCLSVAAAPAPVERTLELSECLQLALQKNLDIRIQRMAPELAQYNLNVSYAAYEPTFQADLSRSGGEQPPSINEFGQIIPGVVSDTYDWSVGFGGLLPIGTRYSLGLSMSDRIEGRILTNRFETSRGNLLGISITQPLLRGLAMDQSRLSIQFNRNALRGSELGLRRQIMLTANQVENTYYNVIAAEDSVRVSQKALELAERLLAENRKRVEVGALAPLDEKQAEAEVASRRADLLSTRRFLEDQQNILKGLLTDDYSAWQGVAIKPAARLTAIPVPLQISDSWLMALTQRPEILESKLNVERQDITIKYQNSQLYPQLDLVGSYGWSGGGLLTREYSDVWQQIDSGDNPNYSIGAQLSVPLGNRAAKNNLRAAKVTREQLLLGLKKLEQSIMVEIDNAIGQVRTAFERAGATKEAREFATAALDAEQKKLENGKSTSFEVLRLQRDLVSAAYSEIRALADYNIALANLSFAEASNLRRLNIDLEVR